METRQEQASRGGHGDVGGGGDGSDQRTVNSGLVLALSSQQAGWGGWSRAWLLEPLICGPSQNRRCSFWRRGPFSAAGLQTKTQQLDHSWTTIDCKQHPNRIGLIAFSIFLIEKSKLNQRTSILIKILPFFPFPNLIYLYLNRGLNIGCCLTMHNLLIKIILCLNI